MNRALAMLLICAAMPASAAEQCIWPFRTGPADVADRMKADLGATLKVACPAKTRIAVEFLLPAGKTPKRIKVDAPECKAAVPAIARWIKARQAEEFMPYQEPQAVAFKIALRFAA
jgi:hypothetical protein